jgi:beta-phosphoglucomutase
MKCIGVGAPEVLGKAHFVIPGLREMNLEKLKKLEREILL